MSPPDPTPPRTSGRLRVTAVLIVVAAVLVWLTRTSDVERLEVGVGERLAGPTGSGFVLVGDDDGAWAVVDPLDPTVRAEIPSPRLGEPLLTIGGTVFTLHPDGMSQTRAERGVVSRVEGLPVPSSARLLGVAVQPSEQTGTFRDVPFVGWVAPGDDALTVRWIDLIAAGTGGDVDDVLRPVVTPDGRTPRVPTDAEVLTSRYGPSFAFVGAEGWEAWTLVGEEGEPRERELESDDGLGEATIGFLLPGAWDPAARVALAPEHRIPVAHFAPDGRALIVEGRRGGGLYMLDLRDGTLQFMAEGNLGASRRVSPGGGFRGDPLRLVTAQWSREDYLQIFETHLSGGGRMSFKVAFAHNYLVALAPSGERMAYAGASFEEGDDAPFDETLYVFDWGDPARGAVELGERIGGVADRGPLFVDDVTVVWIEDGVVRGLRYLPEPDPRTDSR